LKKPSARQKLKTLTELKEISARARAAGKTIVLANGCFDIFHVGHIRYLRGAKSLGDLLVVALNSDGSVRRLKGKGRPILPQRERAEILAAFSFVDYITIFSQPNVEKMLLALRPDIHAKGSDYTEDTVPERDTVKKYGGRVAIAGGLKIRDTSEIIKKIAASRLGKKRSRKSPHWVKAEWNVT
jgi:rfaE bifunctional protein nucleotidyltransferase chain/domain